MKILNENKLIWESYINKIDYVINSDEESDEISVVAFYKNVEIGSAIAKLLFGDFCYELDDVMSEDDIIELFPDNTLVKIEHVEVNKEYRGGGIARELMNRLMSTLEQEGFVQFYLNASPMGVDKGFNKSELVDFYKKFGFSVLLDQGDNTLMIKKL